MLARCAVEALLVTNAVRKPLKTNGVATVPLSSKVLIPDKFQTLASNRGD